jgi:hypothetical protein
LERQFRHAAEDVEELATWVEDPDDPWRVEGRRSAIMRDSIPRLDRAVKRLAAWVEGR